MKRKIIIVGAGIGGLTAAASLLAKGHSVKVYEQAPELGEIGAGLQMSANAGVVLHGLGLGDQLRDASTRPDAWITRLYDTGEIIHEIQLGSIHEQLHGVPYYMIYRSDLHQILVDAVNQLDPSTLVVNASATHYEESGDSVTVHFEKGQSATADVLIGADGIKSVIRNQIVDTEEATYTGNAAWRAMVDVNILPDGFFQNVSTSWVGPRKHAIVYWLQGGKILNFVAAVERENWSEESWTVKYPWEELKQDFEGWHEDIQTVVDNCDKDACYRWALNNREPVDNWRSRRTIIIGDAAHPTLPYMAQGAAMAIEDAAVLTRALQADGDVEDCLELFQRNRLDRTAKIVRAANAMGEKSHRATTAELKAGFEKKDTTSDRDQWLYNYNPLTVPLV